MTRFMQDEKCMTDRPVSAPGWPGPASCAAGSRSPACRNADRVSVRTLAVLPTPAACSCSYPVTAFTASDYPFLQAHTLFL